MAYPAGALSNFHPYKFTFRNVPCNSMEGLLNSLKCEDPLRQAELCKLTGIKAKREGQRYNKAWKSCQTLWWNGDPYPRKSPEYQILLDDIFDSLATNEKFCAALLDTGDAMLCHSMGSRRETDTILTENEFCNRLERIRARLVTLEMHRDVKELLKDRPKKFS